MVRMMAVVGLLNLKVIPGGDDARCDIDVNAGTMRVGNLCTFETIRSALTALAQQEFPVRLREGLSLPDQQV